MQVTRKWVWMPLAAGIVALTGCANPSIGLGVGIPIGPFRIGTGVSVPLNGGVPVLSSGVGVGGNIGRVGIGGGIGGSVPLGTPSAAPVNQPNAPAANTQPIAQPAPANQAPNNNNGFANWPWGTQPAPQQ